MGRNSETVATQDFDRSWTGCNTRCRGLYLHLRRRPMGRTHAPPHLPGAIRLYGEEAKELVLAPVGLALLRCPRPFYLPRIDSRRAPRLTARAPGGLLVFPPPWRCPLPLDLLRSLLVVSPSFLSDISRSRVFDGCLCSICCSLPVHACSCCRMRKLPSAIAGRCVVLVVS
jgi:hypothetical protein